MIVTPSRSELGSAGRQICRQFQLGEIRQLEALPYQGYSNFNARLDTERGAYVLRRYLEQPLDRITHELRVIDWLDSQGIPVIPPLRNPGGEAIVIPDCEHQARWVVFPFVDGEEPTVTTSSAKPMGELVARLHTLPERSWKDGDRENALSVRATLAIADSLRKEDTPSAGRFLHLVTLLAPEVQSVQLPVGLVHGDLFTDNTIFRGDRLVAILDWEEACTEAFLFDLAMTMHGFCYVGEGWAAELARTLLTAYEVGRSLNEGERKSLPLYLRWTALAMAGWHLRRHSLSPNPRQAERIEQLLCRAETEFADDFLHP